MVGRAFDFLCHACPIRQCAPLSSTIMAGKGMGVDWGSHKFLYRVFIYLGESPNILSCSSKHEITFAKDKKYNGKTVFFPDHRLTHVFSARNLAFSYNVNIVKLSI